MDPKRFRSVPHLVRNRRLFSHFVAIGFVIYAIRVERFKQCKAFIDDGCPEHVARRQAGRDSIINVFFALFVLVAVGMSLTGPIGYAVSFIVAVDRQETAHVSGSGSLKRVQYWRLSASPINDRQSFFDLVTERALALPSRSVSNCLSEKSEVTMVGRGNVVGLRVSQLRGNDVIHGDTVLIDWESSKARLPVRCLVDD